MKHTPENTHARLAEKGLKITLQRLGVLTVIYELDKDTVLDKILKK